MFSDPERRHETEITIQRLKQVFIFYSVYILQFYQCFSCYTLYTFPCIRINAGLQAVRNKSLII